MKHRIDWVRQNCRLLSAISAEFEAAKPFAGKTIGTGIHLEPKTVALILTLQNGGARMVSTGNLNSTQPEAVDYLRANGVTVIGGPTRDPDEHRGNLKAVLAEKPDVILDNGGDLFDLYLQDRYPGLLGGTEETTSGRMRLAPMRDELAMPILVINDSPIKQFAENEHAVGQSVLESYMRITNRVTNGQRVTVFGYGACGKGVAANLRAANAKVSVVDSDPLKRLQAHLDGHDTPPREVALASADFIVTVTGGGRIIGAEDLPYFKDGAILANAGHFPVEIDAAGLAASDAVAERTAYEVGVESLVLKDGRTIHVVAEGHMFNLAGPRPMGNSIETMDLGFALQARCLEAV
ncbi:MAG: adenosylhomocysteinase, partial [Bauldia sp.]|nr:adenosylhomocysteinase [Bauldia sp.]